MTNDARTTKARQRAARLRREAGNCVSTAVQMSGSNHAADLIDEAVRLERRSQELDGTEPGASRSADRLSPP